MGRASWGPAPGVPAGAKPREIRWGGGSQDPEVTALAESPRVSPGSVIQLTTGASLSSPKPSSSSSKTNEKGSQSQETMK